MKDIFDWFFSRYPLERKHGNETERLEATMKTTAVNRYNASDRIRWHGKITFLTVTILSLGLIFIPLLQLAGVKLALDDKVLGAMQIFLAVAVLVYSVIIGTARYDLRGEQLNDCGDKLKNLIRELRREKEKVGGQLEKEKLQDIQERYSLIVTDVENHSRNDYLKTILNTEEFYKLTGAIRFGRKIQYFCIYIIHYFPSLLLLLMEFLFILDMLAITTIFSPYLEAK